MMICSIDRIIKNVAFNHNLSSQLQLYYNVQILLKMSFWTLINFIFEFLNRQILTLLTSYRGQLYQRPYKRAYIAAPQRLLLRCCSTRAAIHKMECSSSRVLRLVHCGSCIAAPSNLKVESPQCTSRNNLKHRTLDMQT